MKIIQSHSFEKRIKKLSPHQKGQVDIAVKEILKNPHIGEKKKGNLKMVLIHKFYIDKTMYLLAYSFSDQLIELLMLGPHENYYAGLKNYLKKR